MESQVKKGILVAAVTLIAATACSTSDVAAPVAKSLPVPTAVANGFDAYGYNDVANIFNGPADGVDHNLDGAVWGDPTYANDHLLMKWNRAWENCNASHTPENCAGAWTLNEWNGQLNGGSGESWMYKIQWIGSCGADGTVLADGGYCIWGDYEVIMSKGNTAGSHFWDAHAGHPGFGN